MRCLKRYAAREIYHQITNPQAAPNNTDLRQKRTELGCTITPAARIRPPSIEGFFYSNAEKRRRG